MTFSKGNLLILLFFGMVAGGFFWFGRVEERRIAALASTENRLKQLSGQLAWQDRRLTQLSDHLKRLNDQRRELAQANDDIKSFREVIERHEEAARNDSPLRWAERAIVDLEEYFIPFEEAEMLLEKFDDESSDVALREVLIARKNGLVYHRRFAAVVMPEPRKLPGRGTDGFGRQSEYLDEPRSITRIEDSHPGIIRGENYLPQQRGEMFASEFERLVVHTSLNVDRTNSSVNLALNRGAGLILAGWQIYRDARFFEDVKPPYQVGFETRVPVTPGKFQFVGSTDFQVRGYLGGRVTNRNGSLFVFSRVQLPAVKGDTP